MGTSFDRLSDKLRLRSKRKRNRRRGSRTSWLENLELRTLFTASTSSTPYWQLIMPNMLPDGGQLAKQNSPVVLTIDDGLATNNIGNSIKPIYDSRALGKTVMVLPITVYSPSDLYPIDPDSTDTPPARLPALDTDYSINVAFSSGSAGGGGTFTTDGHYGDAEVAFPIDASSLPTGRYIFSGEITYPDPDKDAPISFIVNVINRTNDPSTNTYNSEFGSGWTLPGLDRLIIQPSTSSDDTQGILYVGGDDQVTWFHGALGGNQDIARSPGPFNFDTLHENDVDSDSDYTNDTYTLTAPDGTVEQFDSNGLLQTRMDRNLNVLQTYSYADKDGDSVADELVSIEDNFERYTTFNYAGSSKVVTSITDFAGRETDLTHDSLSRITRIADPDPDTSSGAEASPVTQYSYDGTTSYLTSVVDPRGLQTQIVYDAVGDVDTITDASIPDPSPHVIDIDSIPSQMTVPTFDADDITEVRNVYGNTSTVTRDDDFYNVVTLHDANGNDWLYTYEPGDDDPNYGTLATVVTPDAGTVTYTYNNDGELTSVKYPDYSYETWSYDHGEISSDTKYPDGNGDFETEPLLYYVHANDTSSNGNFDSVNQYIADGTSDAITTYTYTTSSDHAADDPMTGVPVGLVKKKVDPDGNETDYVYNSDGLVFSVTSGVGTADETTTKYLYDSNDNLSATIDGRGNETDYVYDDLNRLVQRSDPAPTTGGTRPVTKWQYDQDGNLIAQTDPLGNITQYVYDAMNRQVQVAQPVADPSATPLQITVAASVGISTTGGGTWTTSAPSGSYSASVSHSMETSGASGGTATFTITNSSLNANKKYLVEVRWVPSSGTTYDSSAQWQVYGGSSNSLLTTQTVDINQPTQGLPDSSSSHFMWLALGAFNPHVSGSSHSITVTLTGAHGLITVDAVRLVEVGPVSQYGYDDSGNNTTVTDPNGNTTTYAYDSLNRLYQETDPTVNSTTPVTTYTYNPEGWLTSTTDPMSHTTTYFYDKRGDQIGEVEPGEVGGLLGQYYLPGGDVTSIPDFSTLTPDHTREDSDISFSPVSANFNGYSDLDSNFAVRWTGAINITTSGTHDYDFQLQSNDGSRLIIDGNTLININSTSSSTQSDTETISLSAGWHRIEVDYFDHTGDAGIVLKYVQHGGTLATVPDTVLSPIWQSSYDQAGRMTSTTDPLGNTTTYEYDARNLVTSTTDANGHTTSYTYDAGGNKTSETDPVGDTTTWAYDSLNRMSQAMDHFGNSDFYHYDTNGNLIYKSDRDGRIIRYTYDNLNRETTEKWQDQAVAPDVEGAYVFYHGSSFDDKIATDKVPLLAGDTVSSANVTTYDRGITGIAIDFPFLPKSGSSFTINASDFTFKVGTSSNPSTWTTLTTAPSLSVEEGEGVNGSDRVMLTWPDDTIKNEWIQVTVKAGSGYGNYLANNDVFYFGNLVGDANGDLSVTSSGANNDTDVVTENEITGGAAIYNKYDFNKDGEVDGDDLADIGTRNLTSFTGLSRTIGETFTYTYDADNRLTNVSDVDGWPFHPSISYTYDRLGHATLITTGPWGDLYESISLSQSFDANGNRTQLALDNDAVPGIDDLVNNYQYDAMNRMKQVSQQSVSYYDFDDPPTVTNKTVTVAYNAASQFDTISRYDSDTPSTGSRIAVSNYGYNDSGLLNSLLYTNGTATYADFGYDYDAANRVTSFTNTEHSDENVAYTYDATGQLTAANYGDPGNDESYSYDANGNRTVATTFYGSQTFAVDDNRITSDGTNTYTYDNEGNLLSDGVHTYTYDFRNRLIGVSVSGYSVTYNYDAFNRLISRNSDIAWDAQKNIYIYDGNQVIQAYTTAFDGTADYTNLSQRYLWGPAVDMLLAEEDVSGTYSGTAEDATTYTNWMVTDRENTIHDMLGRSGSVAVYNHILTDSFGQDVNGGGDYQNFMFTGRLHDTDTGLQYNGSRMYNASLGRWMSQDPMGLLPDTNPYRYVGNSPTNFVDPSGMWGIGDGQDDGVAVQPINAPVMNGPDLNLLPDNTTVLPFGGFDWSTYGPNNQPLPTVSIPPGSIFNPDQTAPPLDIVIGPSPSPWNLPIQYGPDGKPVFRIPGFPPFYYPPGVGLPPKGIGGGIGPIKF